MVRFNLLLMALASCLAFAGLAAAAEMPATIPSATIGGVSYSNIVVESATPRAVTFSHSRGILSINLSKLTRDEQLALGLRVQAPAPVEPPKPAVVKSEPVAPLPEPTQPAGSPKPSSPAAAWMGQYFEKVDPAAFARMGGAIALAIVGGLFVLYVFTCVCLLFICKKTEHPAPFQVWIPVLQIKAIYRAADMHPFWFNALALDVCSRFLLAVAALTGAMAPPGRIGQIILVVLFLALGLVHVVGWCMWCFKICVARAKSPLLGLLVLFPVTQPPTLAYLAFSK